MKKITKFIFALLAFCCIAGVQSVNAATEKVYATFENPETTPNTTWDGVTKTFTWSNNSYNQVHNLGLPSGDLREYQKIVIDCDIISGDKFRINFYKNGSDNDVLWVTKSGVSEFIIKASVSEIAITNCFRISISGSSDLTEGEVTINEMYLETYPEGESFDDILLTKEMIKEWDGFDENAQPTGNTIWPTVNFGNATDMVYGTSTVTNSIYADLTGYTKMLIKGSFNGQLRVLWNRQADNSLLELQPSMKDSGIIEIDLKNHEMLKGLKYLHLNAIKAYGSVTIEKIILRRELNIVDGENFAPEYDVYTNATYSRIVNPEYSYGTICLPFAPDAATCEKYTFYRLAQAAVDALTFEEVAEPEANIPYLYSAKDKSATTHTFTGGYTEIESEPETYAECGTWMFFGTFVEEFIPVADFGGMMLFYAYKPTNGEDVLVKATNSMTVMPYRAYFIGQETGIGGMEPLTTMRIVVRGQDNGDGTTSIEEIITPDQVEGATPAIYDLMGRPVQQMQKGQIYIVNGKKVMY